MANTLTRPTLLNVAAFDAHNEQIFTFAIAGTTAQIIANKLVIRTQTDNQIVYEEKQESFKYEHIVNADELTNNTYYTATITVFDAEGNESPASIPIQFWCYTTPVITFTNLPANNIIQNTVYNFEFSYTQTEGEKINSYIVNLYNNSDVLLSTSGLQYVLDGTPPFTGSYLVSGFENATSYKIEIIGTTINNTVITTGLINLTTQYIRPDLFTLVELTNNCDEGYISVRSNIILIEGTSNPDPPTYIDDKEVDLTDPDSWVKWDNGYNISGNMTTRIWFRKPTPYAKLLEFINTAGQKISLYYMQGYETVESSDLQSYIEIYVESIQNTSYYIFSNYIDILPDTEYYNVWMTRINNIYQLQLAKV